MSAEVAPSMESAEQAGRTYRWRGLEIILGLIVGVAPVLLLGPATGLLVGQWLSVAVFAAVGAALSVHDLRYKKLPDRLTLPLAGLLAGIAGGMGASTSSWIDLISALAGGLGLAVLLAVIGLNGSVGFGDVKLALSIGVLTGWHAWYLPLYALAVAFLLALPAALIGAVRRRRGSEIHDLPFGPYLIAGGLLATVAATTPAGVM